MPSPSTASSTRSPARSLGASSAARVGRGLAQGGGHRLGVAPEPGTERPEVRGQPVADQPGLALGEADLLDVQLGRDQVQQPGHPGPDRVGHADQGPGQGLAHLELGLGAGLAAQADQPPDLGHGRAQLRVEGGPVGLRPVDQVDRVRGAGVDRDHQPLPQLLGRERRVGGQQQGHRPQAGPQRPEGRVGVLPGAAPEAPPRQPHVPVGQVVHERGQPPGGAGGVVVVQVPGHLVDGVGQLGQDPAVQRGGGRAGRRPGRVKALQPRVQAEEAVGVPEGEEQRPGDVLDGLGEQPPRHPRRPVGQHEPAQRVGPVAVEELERVEHVAEALGHLAAVAVDDVAQADHVAVGGLVEQQRAHGQQRVEPAAGLVDGLGDEVGREGLLEGGPAVGRVRVAPLGERHRPRVEPGVEHVGDPPGLLPAVRAGEGDLVHERPVGVEAGQVAAGLGRQVGQALDHGQVLVGAAPQRQGRAPVAGPGQRPVDVVGQPVAEAAVADVLGAPADAGVLGQQPVLDRRGPGVPGGQRVVDQRRVAAPAERVGVACGSRPATAAPAGAGPRPGRRRPP